MAWMEDSRAVKLTLGLIFCAESDVPVEHAQILHLESKYMLCICVRWAPVYRVYKTVIITTLTYTVDGFKSIPPRFFGHKSLPRCRRSIRIDGNEPSRTPEESRNPLHRTRCLIESNEERILITLIDPF